MLIAVQMRDRRVDLEIDPEWVGPITLRRKSTSVEPYIQRRHNHEVQKLTDD